MFRLLLLAGSVAVVLGGRSPNADYVDQLVARSPSGRYSGDVIEDGKLDVPGLVSKYGYPVESHEVVTPDGYILTLHRIPHGRDQNNKPDPNKIPVILVHGLMASSASWLVLGPENGLGYMLAEEGYDVWLFNARGNFYSRRHTHLDPDDKINQTFWLFSWDEIGNIDLPASLTYIERLTGHTKLHYIGHSQGGTTFLVLNSLNPEYNEKFYSSQVMAPAAIFEHHRRFISNTLAPFVGVIEPKFFAMGRAEVFGNRDSIIWFAVRVCTKDSIISEICSSFIDGGTSDYFNTTLIPVFLGHSPAGASIRQFAHFGQCINSDLFRRYDHGTLTNLRVYGSTTPPEYDLNKITAPMYIHYAKNDRAAAYEDVRTLASRLPNVKGTFFVDSPEFDHWAFVMGSEAKDIVYAKVIRLMKEAENAS